MGQEISLHRYISGTPYEKLTFSETAKKDPTFKAVLKRFKDVTGEDIMAMRGYKADEVANALLLAVPTFKQDVVPQTQDQFASFMSKFYPNTPVSTWNLVYFYYYKKADSSTSPSTKKGLTFWQWLFGSSDTSSTSTSTNTIDTKNIDLSSIPSSTLSKYASNFVPSSTNIAPVPVPSN